MSYRTTKPTEQIHIPHRNSQIAADVGVPLLQALIDGVLVALLVLVLALGVDFVLLPGRWLAWQLYVLLLALLALAVTLYRWPGHLAQARSTAWEYRRIPLDANGDGHLAPSEFKRPVHVAGPRLPPLSDTDIMYNNRLREFVAHCRAATAGRKLEARGWSEDEIEVFASYLIQNGGGRWRNERAHTVGWDVGDQAVIDGIIARTIWL